MGTRGFITFVVDGREMTTYNHFDSYPNGLGLDVLGWLVEAVKKDDTIGRVRALQVVNGNAKPTTTQINRLRAFHNPNVSTGSPLEWYSLLRNTQGDCDAILKAGVMIDARAFPADSLFAEWGYVIDFDANMFEVYQGFQTGPVVGRFARRRKGRTKGYSPVSRVASWPLSNLPSEHEFLAALKA